MQSLSPILLQLLGDKLTCCCCKPHTSYGSDKHAQAKSKCILNPKRSKAKIKSRGFDKTYKRTLGGKVAKRES